MLKTATRYMSLKETNVDHVGYALSRIFRKSKECPAEVLTVQTNLPVDKNTVDSALEKYQLAGECMSVKKGSKYYNIKIQSLTSYIDHYKNVRDIRDWLKTLPELSGYEIQQRGGKIIINVE